MTEPLKLTIVYEDAGDGDGWVVARIPQVRGAISQGASREEARENVIDALRELLAARFGSPPELPEPGDRPRDSLTELLDNAPEDDEPVTQEEQALVQEARDEIARGEPLISLDELRAELKLQ